MRISTEVTGLYRALEASLEAGEPWDPRQLSQLSSCRTAAVLDLFRELQIRVRLREAFAKGLRTLDLDDIATRFFKHVPTRDVASVGDTLTALQTQFFHMTARATANVRRRLTHIYQVPLQPACIRSRMHFYFAMSFIPGTAEEGFAETDVFVPLDEPACLTLTVRPHADSTGRVIDMFDIKGHRFEIHPDSGIVSVGGSGDMEGDTPENRTELAKHFNTTPNTGGSLQTLAAENAATIECGLAMHAAMERAAIRERVQAHPDFPSVYLAFRAVDDMKVEFSPGLERAVFQEIEAWHRSERPAEWSTLDVLPSYIDRLWRPRNWADVVRQLGDLDAKYLCEHYWFNSIVEFAGLFLIPFEFFAAESPQKPVRRAVRIYLYFPNYLLGKEEPASPLAVFAGKTLGRNRAVGYANVQVMRHDCLENLVGNVAGFDFDFADVPEESRQYFQPAIG